MPSFAPRLLGIVNITEDSFSDGGLYRDPERALDRARILLKEGAHAVDLGAASSHPDSQKVGAREEIERLRPVIDGLQESGCQISVDSYNPEVQRFAMERGVRFLNDIQGFPHPELHEALARFPGRLILMHSIQRQGPATRERSDVEKLPGRICDFFDERITALERGGVAREKLILDPGMGFFLGSSPEASLIVLRNINRFKERYHLPLLLSVSRKSFLGALTDREVSRRGAATLSAELFLAEQGVDYIRTHDVGALADALKIRRALAGFRPE